MNCPHPYPDGLPFPPRGPRACSLDTTLAGFLTDEAAALDDGDHATWLELLDESFLYEIPVPLVREDPTLPRHSDTAVLFEATKDVLRLKLNRGGLRYAWADRPGGRTRRFVGPARTFELSPGAVRVDSNLLVSVDHGGEESVLITAGRQDVLGESGDSWQLLRRRVLLDVEVPTHVELSIIF